HVDERGIGELDDEYPVAGYGADGVRVDLPRQCMEAVQDEPDTGMVGAANDLPGVAMVVDVPTPRECLIADPDAESCRDLAELAEVAGRAVDAAQRGWRHIGADQHQVRAEFLHQREFPL